MRKAVLVHALISAALIGLGTSVTAGAQTIPYIWTVAGDGFNGSGIFQNGIQAIRGNLPYPTAIAFDTQGNLYIACNADDGSTIIRKVTPAGIITTIAGTGENGYSGDGGPALSAQFGNIEGIAFDAAGNMYLADNEYNVIRKIDTTGTVSTFAGKRYTQGLGYIGDGGAATAAELHSPSGLAFDALGNLYIADSANYVVRKVNTAGRISTVIGDHTEGYSGDGGPAASAELGTPQGLAFDSAGNLYITDDTDNVVREVAPNGTISTFAGDGIKGFAGDGGLAAGAELSDPIGLAFDPAGNLYLTDDTVIREVNKSGYIGTYAGDSSQGGYTGDGGDAFDATLTKTVSLATDAAGNLYIADYYNNAIRLIEDIVPPATAAPAPTFNVPSGGYLHSQQIAISDALPNAEFHITIDGSVPTLDSPVYENQTLYVGNGFTLRALAVAPHYLPSQETGGTYTYKPPPAPAPLISPIPGKYIGLVKVTIFDTAGYAVSIHYTTDGTTPTISSPSYPAAGLVLNADTARFTVIRAAAFGYGYSPSPVTLASYSIVPQTLVPTISPASGAYPAGQQITITDSVAGAEIRYTTDESIPTIHSPLYRGPLTLTGPVVVRALSIANGEEPSGVAASGFTTTP